MLCKSLVACGELSLVKVGLVSKWISLDKISKVFLEGVMAGGEKSLLLSFVDYSLGNLTEENMILP